MKKLILLVSCVVAWVGLAWADEQMYFVTALSAPIASFNTVETKDCVPTTIGENAQINIGSDAVGDGTVRLLPGSGPMKVESFLLADNTKVLGSANWKKWLISDMLAVGSNGSVTVGGILAEKLQLRNSAEKTTQITVEQTLKVSHNITAKKVIVQNASSASGAPAKLQVGSCTSSEGGVDDCFYFYCDNSEGCGPNKSASAKTLHSQTGETGVDTLYKIIYTN